MELSKLTRKPLKPKNNYEYIRYRSLHNYTAPTPLSVEEISNRMIDRDACLHTNNIQ
jgi:hypothetical protein